MQIPRKIEYALRAMIYLADRPSGVARGTEIAKHEHIPKYYLEKVIRDLMRRGLVHARRGPGGGYQLARKADTVTFRDIIEAVEGPTTLGFKQPGDSVNVENDMLVKYVEKILTTRASATPTA